MFFLAFHSNIKIQEMKYAEFDDQRKIADFDRTNISNE